MIKIIRILSVGVLIYNGEAIMGEREKRERMIRDRANNNILYVWYMFCTCTVNTKN